jgi:hypothetical protein
MRTCLVRSPKTLRVATVLGVSKATVLGAVFILWSMADEQTTNGLLPGLTFQAIDAEVGLPGFCAALADPFVDWARQNDTGVLLPRWLTHNGASAKSRANNARRNAKLRTRQRDGAGVTRASRERHLEKRREEKRREEKTPSSTSTVGSARAESAATTATTAAVVSVGVGERTVTPGGRTHWGPTVEQKPRYEALIIAGVSPTKAMEFVSQPFPTLEAIRRVHDSRTQRGLPADHGLIGQLKTAAAKESIMAERRRAMEEQTR